MALRQDQEALEGALSRSDPAGTGIRRRRCGRGFSYLGPDTAVIKDPRTLARIKARGRAETAVVRLLAGRSQGMDAGRPVSLGCQV
jgi:hypothetical protein